LLHRPWVVYRRTIDLRDVILVRARTQNLLIPPALWEGAPAPTTARARG
jgi:hypothetical protein